MLISQHKTKHNILSDPFSHCKRRALLFY